MPDLNVILDDLLKLTNKYNISFDVNKLEILAFEPDGSALKIGCLIQDKNWEWSAISLPKIDQRP